MDGMFLFFYENLKLQLKKSKLKKPFVCKHGYKINVLFQIGF